MIIVNYMSKRKLKKAIGEILDYYNAAPLHVEELYTPNGTFFASNQDRTFCATITMVDGKISEVR